MSKKIKLFIASGVTSLGFLYWAIPAWAQAALRPPADYNNLANITLDSAVRGVIKILLFVAFTLGVIFLLIGGIRWITSGGDKAAAESARSTLTAAIIGLILVLLTWGILTLIGQVFGINIIDTDIVIPKLF